MWKRKKKIIKICIRNFCQLFSYFYITYDTEYIFSIFYLILYTFRTNDNSLNLYHFRKISILTVYHHHVECIVRTKKKVHSSKSFTFHPSDLIISLYISFFSCLIWHFCEFIQKKMYMIWEWIHKNIFFEKKPGPYFPVQTNTCSFKFHFYFIEEFA